MAAADPDFSTLRELKREQVAARQEYISTSERLKIAERYLGLEIASLMAEGVSSHEIAEHLPFTAASLIPKLAEEGAKLLAEPPERRALLLGESTSP